MNRRHPLIVGLFLTLALLAAARDLHAEPFTVQALLTGDIRLENPDNIVVRVSVSGDTESNQAFWTVDLDSAAHPQMFLGGFFFNLDMDSSDVQFSNFSPISWNVTSSSHQAQGSGGAQFSFVAKDPPQSSNNVTNLVNLTFIATLTNGSLWNPDLLLNAPLSDGDAIANPGAQLGVHVRSLSTADCETCTTDSGFAAGNYTMPSVQPVPEPSSLLLLGSGATAALVRWRRRRSE